EDPALRAAGGDIMERCDVTGLLSVSWQRQEDQETNYVGPGRGSAQRATRTEVRVRYQITEVRREAAAIEARRQRLSWHVLVTNSLKKRLSLLASVLSYRSGWSLERDFHLLKDN